MPMLFPTRIALIATALGIRARLLRATECVCTTPAPTAPAVTPTTSTPMIESPEQTRTIAIKNMCSFDVDVGFTGGFAGPAPCEGNQVEDIGGERCFWSLELPDLLEAGRETIVEIQKNDDAETDVVVSGAIYGVQSPYLNDVCPGGCTASKGPAGTTTLSEFTMLENPTRAYYDLSHVHGANIPTTFGVALSADSDTDDIYRNGVAGGECSWSFDPPEEYRKYLIEVKNARGSCSQDDECDEGKACGASFVGDTPVYGTCGDLFAYVNAHANCIEGSQGFPFYCEVYHDLYGCAGKYNESGYSESVTSADNVCGCSDYDGLGIPSSFPCINSNPIWMNKSYPWIEYVKKGCPSSYEYAYSDSTSTFVSDYDTFELVFCPGDSEQIFYG